MKLAGEFDDAHHRPVEAHALKDVEQLEAMRRRKERRRR
jgi:hypothetical protein